VLLLVLAALLLGLLLLLPPGGLAVLDHLTVVDSPRQPWISSGCSTASVIMWRAKCLSSSRAHSRR
jgi:hypothetical protein